MAGRQIKGQGGRRERLLTPHDLAGIVTAQQGFVSGPVDYNSLINKPILATVATSGSYTDLLGKPTAFPPNGPAGGSLTGTYPNPGVIVPVSSVFGRTGAVVAATNDYSCNQINGLIIPQGYIDGLQMVWNSTTSISVTSGTAYILSLANVLASTSTLTLSGLSLTPSTWYHIYLYSNSGTPAIECVTTAPFNYYGTAYQKTGDISRRYLASVLTDSGGGIYAFTHHVKAGVMSYLAAGSTSLPFRILSNGTATVNTNVSLTGVAPVSYGVCDTVFGVFTNLSNVSIIVSPVSFTLANTNYRMRCEAANSNFASLELGGSSQLTYKLLTSPTSGGFYMDINGFSFER